MPRFRYNEKYVEKISTHEDVSDFDEDEDLEQLIA